MSEVIEINGEHFVPASFAGTQVGYTSDYVARLAREEKISATKVGRQWFVSLKSLNAFVREVGEKKIKRREALRIERKTEKSAYMKEALAQKKADANHGAFSALVQTAMILLLGVLVGTGGYLSGTGHLASVRMPDVPPADMVALSVYEFFSADEEEVATIGLEVIDEEEDEEAVVADEPLPIESLTAEMFSDDVEVEKGEEEEMIAVTPKLKNGGGEVQRFFLVPVTEAGEVKTGFQDLVGDDVEGNEEKN